MKKVTIYTDGACRGNPGKGGWGAVLLYNGHVKEISGEKKAVEQLAAEYRETVRLLRSAVESNDVNMAYIYDILDKWAEDRKVRTKKKNK